MVVLVGLLALALAGTGVARNMDKASKKRSAELSAALSQDGCTPDQRTDPGSTHVKDPKYKVDPPAGGDHLAEPADPGIYEAGRVPVDGQLVHSEEHGFLVLWYRPDAPPDQVASLKELAKRHKEATLVVPRASLPVPVAATAWHHRLLCSSGFTAKPLERFVTAYRDKGPESGFVKK